MGFFVIDKRCVLRYSELMIEVEYVQQSWIPEDVLKVLRVRNKGGDPNNHIRIHREGNKLFFNNFCVGPEDQILLREMLDECR